MTATCSPSAPIVAAVEASTAAATAATAARLARELAAPLSFVFVRRPPSMAVGEARARRQLDRELQRGRQALDVALAAASRAGVMAHGEIVVGIPERQILDFANARRARLLVVGSRRRRCRPSVSQRVVRAAGLPVVVAA